MADFGKPPAPPLCIRGGSWANPANVCFRPIADVRLEAILSLMNIVRRYRTHLASRATGLSRLGWYVASAREGAPWALATFVPAFVASFVPEPNRLLAIGFAFVPGFIGWTVTQSFMGIVHHRDLRSRAGRTTSR